MIITHNLSAMQTNRHLNLNNRGVSKSLEKLSSGYRINVGADDPSGLIISEQLRSQISSVSRAIQNTSEANNLIGLTEGALTEMNEILKKMRALAIHAANNGVTSPEQVKADQQEVDSGISTLERIANTTRYSDQYLLNGSKQLVYDRNTQVKTTMDHTLINMEGSRVDQIFKRAGVSMSFAYSGTDANGYVNNTNEAKRAYLEADSVTPDPHKEGAYIKSDADLNDQGELTATQEFILTGTKGTKLFKFTAGTSLGTMAQSINNSKDSLGVGATLTFSADARVDKTTNSTYKHTYTDWSTIDDAAWTIDTDFASADSTGANLGLKDVDGNAVTGVTVEGALVNPNAFALAMGINPNSADATIGETNLDMNFTLVQPVAEGDQWTLSVGTTAGANDLAEILFRPDSETSYEFTQGPLAGLTIDFGALLARDSAAVQPYAGKITAANIDLTNGTLKENAVVNDVRNSGEVQIYGANINGGLDEMKVSGVGVRNADDFRAGMNCDGDGRVYAKVTKFINDTNYEVEWYKDAACTMLIGTSPSPNVFSATNNSGIANGGLTIALTNNAQVGDVYTVGLIGQEFTLARDSDGVGGLDQPADFNVEGLGGWQGMSDTSLANAVMSGVSLGYNTSDTGQLYFRAEGPPDARVISVYKDKACTPSSLVATGTADLSASGQRVIRLEEVVMDNGQKSGLNMTIPFTDAVTSSGLETGTITFTNVALRLYSTDYGESATISIQNRSGTLFHQYRNHDSLEREYVQSGTTVQVKGQDAVLSLNGFPIRANGILANVTTADFSGSIQYNAGVLGLTTIATAGYEVGKLLSRAGALQGIEENERKMRQIALSQGYTIQPPRTTLGDPATGTIAGLTTNSNPSIPDNGELEFDFSQIDTTGYSPEQLANLKAMMNGGLRVELAPGSTTTDSVKMLLHWTDREGVQHQLDIGAAISGNNTGDFMDQVTEAVNATDVPFNDIVGGPNGLNSASGFKLDFLHDAADELSILSGLVIKGNTLTNSSGISAAPRTVYDIDATLDVPSFSGLTEVVTYATNARHSTTESLENFIGGMQFQLGGNEGDQDRTVYSIPSMVMANVGRIEIDGRIYTLQDVLGSSDASLINDPILAMQIITQAIDDVSTLRGRLGAFQANTLETNENSLTIAVEMLQKTESAIRDVDMASESTEFTKNQILVQAGTAMLAQANQISQNVLQLLG